MSDEDPWRLLAAITEENGGEMILYAVDVDALPADVQVDVQREKIITASNPEGYPVIVLKVRGENH